MSGWPYSVGKAVAHDGCLKFGERRYWSADSAKFAQQWVSARLLGADDQMVIFWQGDEESARKYVAHLIEGQGFFDADGAMAVMDRRRAQRAQVRAELADEVAAIERRNDAARASVIRGQAEALLDLIDSRVGKARHFPCVLGSIEFETLKRAIKRLARGSGLLGIKPLKNAEQEGVVAADPGLDQVEAILVHLHAVFGGHLHGGVAPAVDDAEPAAVDGAGQSLCRPAEKTPPESGVGGAA